MLGLKVDHGDASNERSTVLEPWHLLLLGRSISIVVPIVVPSLVALFILLAIPAAIVIWPINDNLSINFALYSK